VARGVSDNCSECSLRRPLSQLQPVAIGLLLPSLFSHFPARSLESLTVTEEGKGLPFKNVPFSSTPLPRTSGDPIQDHYFVRMELIYTCRYYTPCRFILREECAENFCQR
jgi:hypothetical protein